jgi:hypothetical protein
MNNRTFDRLKAFEGLRPSFSAHVRWCEHGAPIRCAVARSVHSSLNLPKASCLVEMTKLLHGAAIPTVAATEGWSGKQRLKRLVENQAKITTGLSTPVLMNDRTFDRLEAFEGLRPSLSAHVRWCEHGAPIRCAAARTVHSSLKLPQASCLIEMTKFVARGRRFPRLRQRRDGL